MCEDITDNLPRKKKKCTNILKTRPKQADSDADVRNRETPEVSGPGERGDGCFNRKPYTRFSYYIEHNSQSCKVGSVSRVTSANQRFLLGWLMVGWCLQIESRTPE